jgi:hypothetical protein
LAINSFPVFVFSLKGWDNIAQGKALGEEVEQDMSPERA